MPKGFQKGNKIGGRFKKGSHPKNEFQKGYIPWNKGKHHTRKTKRKISKKNKDRKFSEEIRKKMSERNKGEKSSLWRGGISFENDKIRHSIEFKLWRETVYARDNWTCQRCGKRGGINPHHIKNFAKYPELRFAIDNGITLCKECHRKFHRKYGIKDNTKEQLKEFLNL